MTLARSIAVLLAAALAAPTAFAKKSSTGASGRAVDEAGLRITNGLDSQAYMGLGKGVVVAVLDAGIDVTHPAIRGSLLSARDFTGQKTTDDDKGDAGHGTGIAGIMIGHDGSAYTGLAPAAKLINARVTTADDKISDLWAGNGLAWAARSNAKVVNMSFGNKLGKGPLTNNFNLMCDYVAERYGVNVVSAAGNENDTAVNQTPAGNYNGYSVGALAAPNYNRVTWFSNYSLASDGRTKPDLVAPGEKIDLAAANWEKSDNYSLGTGTSFAAPMVGGVLAQMIGYGKSHKLPTDPMLLKAILMTSATQVQKYDGSQWQARRVQRDADYGFRYTQPLDEEQGAGRLDAVAAYRLYAKTGSKSTPVNVWKESKLKVDHTFSIDLGKLAAGQRMDSTLTWYRHVAYKDKNGNGPDGKDTYYQTATLADFTLTLVKDGVPVAQSDSDVDNLEHLSWLVNADGKYRLDVYRFDGSGLPTETFALAARVLKGEAVSSLRARTMMVRASGPLAASGELRSLDPVSVPEPGMIGSMLMVGMMVLGMRRR